jgi:hypothetical protein
LLVLLRLQTDFQAKILYTFGIDSVPKVSPAIACIPPTFKILVTPHKLAAYKIAGFIFPFIRVNIKQFLQPAIFAGTANDKTIENKVAFHQIYQSFEWVFSCQH